jgi:hypothetical protein
MLRKPHTLPHPLLYHHPPQDIADLHGFWACRARRETPSIPLRSQCLMQAYMGTYFAPLENTEWLSCLTLSSTNPTKVRPGARGGRRKSVLPHWFLNNPRLRTRRRIHHYTFICIRACPESIKSHPLPALSGEALMKNRQAPGSDIDLRAIRRKRCRPFARHRSAIPIPYPISKITKSQTGTKKPA